MKNSFKCLLLGAPGVGKGTYASQLKFVFNVPHISTGDLIRNEIRRDTALGQQCKHHANQGTLVPDDLVLEIARHRLSNSDCHSGWILDGFPRTEHQAKKLEEFNPPQICLNLSLPDSILIRKLSGRRVCETCGRNYNVADIRDKVYDMPPLLPQPSDCEKCKGQPCLMQREDDTESVVKKRLEVYKNETEPLVRFYEYKRRLIQFDVKRGIKDLPAIQELLENNL